MLTFSLSPFINTFVINPISRRIPSNEVFQHRTRICRLRYIIVMKVDIYNMLSSLELMHCAHLEGLHVR